MGDKIKIGILERNGVNEPNEDCEVPLEASIVEIDPSVDGLDDLDQFVRVNKNRSTVNQTAHGFTLPSYGVIPVYYDNVSGNYVEADASAITTAADVLVVGIVDANNFIIQEGGYLFGAHGLDVGKWYVLDDTAGQAIALDSYTEENIQYLFFTVDANTMVLRPDPIYIREPEAGPAISELQGWVQSASSPVVSAGTNRMLLVAVNWEDGITNGISSITVGGVAATLVEEQTIVSGIAYGAHLFRLMESDIAAMSGTAVSISWNNGVPDTDFVTSFASFENVDQSTPVVATNTDSGAGGTDTLDADVNTEDEGYALMLSGGGNTGMGFANNGSGWTRDLNLTIISADGVVDSKLITTGATPENANMGITGSNRHVLVAASFRKEP